MSNRSKLGGWIVGLSAAAILIALCAGFLVTLRQLEHKPTPAAPPTVEVPGEHSVLVESAPPVEQHMGYVPNPVGVKAFLDELPKPLIRDAAPDLFGDDAGGDCFLYRALPEAYKATYGSDWTVGEQGIGDCVSWGWAHGIDIALAVEWKLGQVSEFKMVATESVYGGSRVEASGKCDGARAYGGYGDGSYGAAAAKYVSSRGCDGGVLFRQDYPGHFDLTKYSIARAKDWGAYGCGGKGDNCWADKEAKQHACKHVALVRTFDEAAAAIRSGYPVPVCSGQGFTSSRDKDGFCRASGSWAHCMCFIAVRTDRLGLLCLNSWGPNAQSGPKYPSDQPDGSFWVEKSTANRMLSGDDSFAVSAADGFPLRPLNNGDWVSVEPRKRVGQDASEYALAP